MVSRVIEIREINLNTRIGLPEAILILRGVFA
jgi:hypothetical protein